MAAKTYTVLNGPAPGAAATPKVAVSTVKTMIQILTSSSIGMRVVEWWSEFDAFAAAQPGQVELLRMANVTTPATVTAYTSAMIAKTNDPAAPDSLISLGTSASGYTASAEGTMSSPFNIAQHLVAPTGGIYIQYPLGREPELGASHSLRLRMTFGTSVNAIAGIVWEE